MTFIKYHNPGDRLSISANEWNEIARAVNELRGTAGALRRKVEAQKGMFDLKVTKGNDVYTATLFNSSPFDSHNHLDSEAGIIVLPSSFIAVPVQSVSFTGVARKCLYLEITFVLEESQSVTQDASHWNVLLKCVNCSAGLPSAFQVSLQDGTQVFTMNRMLAYYLPNANSLTRVRPLGILELFDIWD